MMEQKNLIVAIALSLAILLGFQFLYELPKLEREQARQAEIQAQGGGQSSQSADGGGQVPTPAVPGQAPTPSATGQGSAPLAPGMTIDKANREDAISASPRIQINTPRVSGSIALKGARFDDVTLVNYRETIEPDSDVIHLLEPTGLAASYYAEFGWVPEDRSVKLPSGDDVWQADGSELTVDRPINLTWDNGQGLVFKKNVSIDENYLISVVQTVSNNSDKPVNLFPYAYLSRGTTPDTLDFYILHEGPLGVFDGTLKEIDYSDLQESGKIEAESTGGWIGITDKYWLAAIIPDQQKHYKYRFLHNIAKQVDRYQTDYLGDMISIAPGAQAETKASLFAGAKEVKVLDKYAEEMGIENFDLAIDFGWFYFLTKPFFYILNWMNGILGNFGLAILGLTVCIKALFFPLANKSYKSMAKLRELTPKMQAMREKFGDDKQALNAEMMKLYKEEKVNPAAGCLPIVIQIPVFFALYKVLFVSIEMRQAPFYGWIQDLSVADPTSIFNAFGLIPWTPPEFLMIGIWPLIMGVTMYIQQKLNPQPADPVQAKIFMFLPIFFTFLLARFPAGLVIYWAWNNSLSVIQQYIIMKRMGVR